MSTSLQPRYGASTMGCGPPGCYESHETGKRPVILDTTHLIGQPAYRPPSATAMHPSTVDRMRTRDQAEYGRLSYPDRFTTTNQVYDRLKWDSQAREGEGADNGQTGQGYIQGYHRRMYKGQMESAYTKTFNGGIGSACYQGDRAVDLPDNGTRDRVLNNALKKNPVDFFVAIRPGPCHMKSMSQTMAMLGAEKTDKPYYHNSTTALSLEMLDNPRRWCYPGPPGCGDMCKRPAGQTDLWDAEPEPEPEGAQGVGCRGKHD
mmetsp:Transcript_35959/g.113747  ORF Transcript_35959/g.113747 Transcript_35959/m.113747 type:complete len:261 (+) Transcript_35959:44-826(+)